MFEIKAHFIISPYKGCVELQECEVGEPGPNEVQVRVHASLISPGTERAWILGLVNTPCKYPFEPGYSAAGIVEKVGKEVTKFKVGDRVLCEDIGHRSIGNSNEECITAIPAGVSFEEVVFLPLAQTSIQGVRKARIEFGERVMVIGLGIVGQLALQFARLDGALPVVGVDRIGKRLKIALECGADQIINATIDNWVDTVEKKPQVVIEATGATDAVPDALSVAGTMGRVVLLGSTRGGSTIDFYNEVHKKGITIIGAHAFHAMAKYESRPGYWTSKDDTDCILYLMEKLRLSLNPLITRIFSWENAIEAYNRILSWDSDMLGVIIKWQ